MSFGTHKYRQAITVTGVAVVMTLGLAACGSSTKSHAAGSSTTAPSFTGSYKIMQIVNKTQGAGVQAPAFPEAAVGAQAAANAINAAGGVNHNKIDLIVCDTQGLSNNAITCANQGVSDGVVAFVGDLDPTNSNYLSVAQTAHIPVLAPYPLGPAVVNPISFPIAGGAFAGDVTNLASHGLYDLALAFYNSAAASSVHLLLDPVKVAYPKLNVSLVAIPPTAVDMAPYVQSSTQHQGVVIGLPGQSFVAYLNAYSQSGSKTPLSNSTSSVTKSFLQQVGTKADGMYVTGESMFYNANTPAAAAFRSAMAATDPSADLNEWSENSYEAVYAFADIVKGMTNVTSASLLAELPQVKNLSPGLIAPVSFDQPAPQLAKLEPRIFNVGVEFGKIENGQIVPQSGGGSPWVNAFTGQPIS